MKRFARHAPAALLAIAAVAMLAHGPIAQPADYHRFADTRAWLGLANAADVLSNVGFAAVGAWGLWRFRGAAARQALGAAWPGYALFLASLVMTAAGSAFYHLAPDDARLYWDRLPIALACAGLLAGAFADTHVRPYSIALPVALGAFAFVSVTWWSATGDLRPYLLLQAAPLVIIPLWQWLARSPAVERLAIAGAALLYAAAKVLELADQAVFEALAVVSGHTLKHALAIAASALIVASLAIRARAGEAGEGTKPVPAVSLWDLQRLGGRGGP